MIAAFAFLLSGPGTIPADTVPLSPGLVITRSVIIRAGEYRLSPLAGDSVVLRVRGSGIVVDFGGAVLSGGDPGGRPDEYHGIGVLIEDGRGITLRNARIRGFKVGVLARNVRNLLLARNDVSYNWKPRLWSGPGHESLVDWLTYHRNEQDAWLRYGAGIYLTGVDGGEIRDNVARQGMNGLLLVRSSRLRIWNNDFSFQSGLGIGLYRASYNTIMHNRADWCMRGYVHGGYSRGQDSAALLLYEQSSHNVVAYNSMTHSGDGLFLWAGQSTMETGKGGANDNLFFGNDFSFAAANSIEVTFSRNRMIGNRLEGSTYGVWGGYSFESEIRDNYFARNVVGLAIEHGQDNLIAGNIFDGDRTAIRLWWNRIEPSEWGYPRHRDTRSRDYRIEGNRFLGNGLALRLEHTRNVRLVKNVFGFTDTLLSAAGDTSGFRADRLERIDGGLLGRTLWRPDPAHRDAPPQLPGAHDPMLPAGARQGRHTILIDQWGPYDWRSPKLWPARLADSAYLRGPLALAVLGPTGTWRLLSAHGVRLLSDSAGDVGDTVVVTPVEAPVTDWWIELEYRGGEVIAPNGARTAAGAPYRFTYRRFVAPVHWAVRVAAWDSTSDPRTRVEAFRAALAGPPLAARREPALDYMWSRPRLPGFPPQRFGVLAEGEVELPAGEYDLVTISDDGIRVWIDDQLAIDRWEAHESALAIAPLRGGRRRLRVEYYQVEGWMELRVEVRK
ncbi:MAG TPA: NosD domain-containing protein [Gemmatimonadales bacterium]